MAEAPASAEKPVSPRKAAYAEKAASPGKDCGRKHGELYIIRADGDCFFNSIIHSMTHHPCGDILGSAGLPRTYQELRHLLSSSGLNLQCYTEIFEKIKSLTQAKLKEEYGEEETFEENSKGHLKQKTRIRFPYPWIIEFLKHKKDKKAFTLEKFIEYANERMSSTSEFASNCEVDAMTKLLNSHGIELEIKWGIPAAEMNFGTKERPIINIKYNGQDHYDAIVPRKGNSQGGTRRKRRQRKTRYRY
jgi:hypothetical protein